MGGTTGKAGKHAVNSSKSGVRHGPSNKNIGSSKRKPHPSAPTGPLKGPDHGGV